MASINSLRSLVLDLPPSCVEFWPYDPGYAIVGTYHLEREEAGNEKQDKEDETQQRSGSLVLLKVVDNDV